MKRLAFKIHGLDCAEEVAILKRALGPIVGGDDRLYFDALNGKLSIDISNGVIASDAIAAAVAKTGMKAEPWTETNSTPQANAHRPDRIRHWMCLVSGAAIVAAYAVHAYTSGWFVALTASENGSFQYPAAAAVLYLVATACSIWMVLPKAWYALKSFRPDINLLMTIAVAGALALGNLMEAALVSFLFAVALILEAWSVGRARRAIASLMRLAPDTARVLKKDTCCSSGHIKESEMRVADVPLETIVLVKPGERVPLDGVVTKGETSINQAPITGESVPVSKSSGSTVFAGTINNEGAFEFATTKRAEDTSLARIIHMVEDAQAHRSQSEQWVEKFARYYTPAMVALAALVAVAPPLLFGWEWAASIYNALVLLLIACPCALVISTPVSIIAGISTAARAGVLIKGGAYLEVPARLKAIAFDKTGTLTHGKPVLQRIVPLNGMTEVELLSIAAAIEANSAHPLAAAITERAREDGLHVGVAEFHQTIPGKGAEGVIDGVPYWIGNERMVKEKSRDGIDARNSSEQLQDAGHAILTIGSNGTILGLISVADAVRPESAAAVRALRAAGIEHIAMLTGDNAGTAKSLAAQTGVDAYFPDLMPEDKVTRIQELKARYGSVGMIGDGVNDAPAMAASDLAIAMGAVGSDAAIETADIALMSDDLSRVAWLIRHSQRTLRTIKQNVAIALGLKVAVFALSLAGMATLWLAILADMGGSLIVVMNALRLLKDKR
jgi:Cd2+/Zn2+-exporting ATPase